MAKHLAMIDLIRGKIDNLSFNGIANTEELRKLMGATQFAFMKLSRHNIPPYDDFTAAIYGLAAVAVKYPDRSDKATFDGLKNDTLFIIDKLKKGLADNKLEESDSMAEILHGETFVEMEEQIDFALLMVEQKYIEYFKKRTSRQHDQPHDRLFSYYFTYKSGTQYSFGFHDNSIPDYIRIDARNEVDEVLLSFGTR